MATLKTIASTEYRHRYALVGDPIAGPVEPDSPAAEYRRVMNIPITKAEIQDCYHQLVLTTHTNYETPYRLWVYTTTGGILVDLAPWHEEDSAPTSPLEAWLPIRVALYRYGSATEISRWDDYLHMMSDLPIQLNRWIHSLWNDSQK